MITSYFYVVLVKLDFIQSLAFPSFCQALVQIPSPTPRKGIGVTKIPYLYMIYRVFYLIVNQEQGCWELVFCTSKAPKGFYVTPRSGANYF